MATATNNKTQPESGSPIATKPAWDFRFGPSDVAIDGHLLRNRADEI